MAKTKSLITPKTKKMVKSLRQKFEAKREILKDQMLHVHIRDAAIIPAHIEKVHTHHNQHGVSPTLRDQLRFIVAQKAKVQHAEQVVREQLDLVENALKAN